MYPNSEEYLGSVKIVPLINTKLEDIGYQYFKPNTRFDLASESQAYRYLPIPKGYFEIDTTNVAETQKILDHIIHLMLTENIAFVVKEETSTLTDGKMICAFSYRGFLTEKEIFSGVDTAVLKHPRYRGFDHQQFILSTRSSSFDIKKNNERWVKNWERTIHWPVSKFNEHINIYLNP